jgi:hypothetical protein
MLSFAEFVAEAIRKGDAVNTLFVERLFGLISIPHKITGRQMAEKVPHELIGGLPCSSMGKKRIRCSPFSRGVWT